MVVLPGRGPGGFDEYSADRGFAVSEFRTERLRWQEFRHLTSRPLGISSQWAGLKFIQC
jgi:hypothetical protein